MRAIVQQRYGGVDQLELRDDVPTPAPGKGEVLVRVRAAAIDRGTEHLMTGEPLLVRVALGFRGPRQQTPGYGLAGVVEQVGPEVADFARGDEVVGVGRGSLAEFAVAETGRITRKPEGLSFEQAASLTVSGATALQGLRDIGRVRAGQHVLVVGASGGVGSHAVQIAKAMGARVTGVAGPTNLDFVRGLGADHVVDYLAGPLSETTRDLAPFDVVLDINGNRRISDLRRLLTPSGMLVIVGGEGGGRVLRGLERQLGAILLSPFVSHRLAMVVARDTSADLRALLDLVEAGTLRPVVDRVFPLADTAKAMSHLADGHVRGKVVVTP
jgi:NADPH:quinone reductase-like Zn-dependent oxidoreductase